MSDLASRYRRYLDCLNDRRFEALGAFVCDDVVHNDRPLGVEGYRTMLRENVETIPDLRFEIGLLVVDADQVAARLDFRCTPVRPFLGLPPTGRPVAFCEHVFYRYRGGRIAQVWSLLDEPALARQMAR